MATCPIRRFTAGMTSLTRAGFGLSKTQIPSLMEGGAVANKVLKVNQERANAARTIIVIFFTFIRAPKARTVAPPLPSPDGRFCQPPWLGVSRYREKKKIRGRIQFISLLSPGLSSMKASPRNLASDADWTVMPVNSPILRQLCFLNCVPR